MSLELQITTLKHEWIAEAGRVQGRAFFEDPAFVFTFPDDERRREGLPWLMQIGVAYGERFGHVDTTAGTMIGHAVWLPPGRTELSPSRMEDVGFVEAPRHLKEDELERFGAFVDTMAAAHERFVPGPHWYLMVLGVEPAHQGQGAGSALIAPTLARADAEGLPCYLDTAKERNLAFYRRHGFEVRDEQRVPGGGPRVWAMVREPREGAR